ncbi:MFS transporter [Sphaerisporangium rubeum]|uniref:EmrB/QacA subfamily drug resistance transporter n=1 Tax=Sphaerisporangium rubeum TaxID=321317 RepID=A0A7X0IKI6_9ACTN|nr:MFS transporter [Sphaerisporangium rubeum]MBB6475678.1 EmrB/QacA subfamily drug resistance transporter [Sphaerisporangium rubeum]
MSRGGNAAPQELPPRTQLIATIGAILALALASIDVSVVGAAMPRIADELNGLGLYAWVGVSYAVAAAVVVPIAGKFGDMFGRKPVLLTGLAGFVVASWLCGFAQTMPQLVGFRGLAGLFGGILMANIFTMLADIYTPERRTQMQGVFFGVAGLSMVIGPPIGGLITDAWSWRWVFYVNVPLGLLAILAVVVGVPYVRSSASWRDIDFGGVVTLIAGVVPILIGLTLTGQGHAWTSPEVLALVIGGALMLVVFFLVETRKAANPLVPFPMFRQNQFAVMVVVAFFSAFAMMGVTFYVPLLYQGVLGVSATHSGTLLIPMTLGLMLVGPIAGKAMTAMTHYRYLAVFAMLAIVAGLWMLSTVGTHTGQVVPIVAMVLIGVGIGIAFPMATAVVQSAIPMSQMGVGTSQIQFWRMFAGPVSLAILGSILTGQVGVRGQSGVFGGGGVSPEQLAGALHDVFLTSAIAVCVGLVATFFLKEVPLRDMSMAKKAAGKGHKGKTVTA